MEFDVDHYRRSKAYLTSFSFRNVYVLPRILMSIDYMLRFLNGVSNVSCHGLQSTITALFAAGDDVGEALAMAANSVGLKEMLFYEVEELEDCDWVLKVEVLSGMLCLFLVFSQCTLISC